MKIETTTEKFETIIKRGMLIFRIRNYDYEYPEDNFELEYSSDNYDDLIAHFAIELAAHDVKIDSHDAALGDYLIYGHKKFLIEEKPLDKSQSGVILNDIHNSEIYRNAKEEKRIAQEAKKRKEEADRQAESDKREFEYYQKLREKFGK